MGKGFQKLSKSFECQRDPVGRKGKSATQLKKFSMGGFRGFGGKSKPPRKTIRNKNVGEIMKQNKSVILIQYKTFHLQSGNENFKDRTLNLTLWKKYLLFLKKFCVTIFDNVCCLKLQQINTSGSAFLT